MTKRNNQKKYVEYIGWIGVILVIGSYGLLATGIVDSSNLLYHSLVLLGATAVAVTSYKKHDMQPAVLNVLFAALALFAICRILLT